ncbi:DUF885 domain-containing protein [Marinicauda pacifica]|jgi:uncharacterized protein (DUF885 family)|uniref:DUF885 domain-containing protein n=1 Tax=Marinicauda pacifica TaxID=1133559 RepID=A0A4S2H921_9PROT|nr:DUF885 domain-containing protein [Marinicauda pacifica]TGY92340.1 DUF885 domain-containing protein [Marinicauda pacifica]
MTHRPSLLAGVLSGTLGALCLGGLALAQPAQDFEQLVEDYEAYNDSRDIIGRGRKGDLEAAAMWPDRSFEAITADDEQMEAFHDRLEDIDETALEGQDRASYAVLDYILSNAVALPDATSAMMPFTNDSGFQSMASFIAMSERPRTVEQAEAWIARIEALPAHLAQYRAWLERGMELGWTQPRDILPGVADQLDAQIADDPAESVLFQPIANLPETIGEEERARLREAALAAIEEEAMPAYRQLSEFFREEYMPAGREELGISSVPGGREWYEKLVRYHTTLDQTPEEVHQRGQAEVARIRAEMEEVIAESGFEGSFEEFLDFLRTDEQFYAETEEELLMHAAWLAKQADDQMPAFFNHLPRLPYGVRPVPASIAPSYTTARYWGGSLEEGRAGGYMVNTYQLDQRPLYELPALTLHEAVPGHHHQVAIAQELDNVPEFRRENYITAFGEGWGLYSERIGLDMGIYDTPYEHFGRLTYEMWRACRLVADTGIHWYGWSRDEAEACFLENSALSELNIRNEVSRYISWPGQALAYKTGELLIRELRTDAEEALGENFDLAEFHDAVLEDGALPLAYLEDKMRTWIEEQAQEG